VQLGVLRHSTSYTWRSSRAPTHRRAVPGRWSAAANCTAIGKALLAWEDWTTRRLAAVADADVTPTRSDVNALITELHEIKDLE